VFKVATFHLDAGVKTSSPLLNCHVSHWFCSSHADTMHAVVTR